MTLKLVTKIWNAKNVEPPSSIGPFEELDLTFQSN